MNDILYPKEMPEKEREALKKQFKSILLDGEEIRWIGWMHRSQMYAIAALRVGIFWAVYGLIAYLMITEKGEVHTSGFEGNTGLYVALIVIAIIFFFLTLRILYLLWREFRTRFMITNKRVVFRFGIFKKWFSSCRFEDIRYKKVIFGFFGLIFKTGRIRFSSRRGSLIFGMFSIFGTRYNTLYAVSEPHKVASLIDDNPDPSSILH